MFTQTLSLPRKMADQGPPAIPGSPVCLPAPGIAPHTQLVLSAGWVERAKGTHLPGPEPLCWEFIEITLRGSYKLVRETRQLQGVDFW